MIVFFTAGFNRVANKAPIITSNRGKKSAQVLQQNYSDIAQILHSLQNEGKLLK